MRQQIRSLVERLLGRGHFSGEENMSVRCPFHKGGEETRPSFSINVTNGVWHCFTGCGGGSLPKLLHLLGLSREKIDEELKDLREELEYNKQNLKWKKEANWKTKDPFLAAPILPETILRPYHFCPTKLVEAGFDQRWLEWMDVGFDRNNNRITYPIRDVYGNLAGISGGATVAGQYPKYKVYQGKHQDPVSGHLVPSPYGQWFDEQYPEYWFKNHNYLWNYDNIYPTLFFGKEVQTLIIVEGFKACLWLLQNGWNNTVALMGSSMSEQQSNLIHRLRSNVILFLDNDEAGWEGTKNIASRVQRFQPGVHIAHYPYAEECQPDDLTPAEVAAAIQGSENYPQWRKRFVR
jgi:DNA primase